jgi:hypothetical protein
MFPSSGKTYSSMGTMLAASTAQKEVDFSLCCHDRTVSMSVIRYLLFSYPKCHSQTFSTSLASFPPWTSAHIHTSQCHDSFLSTAVCINKLKTCYPIQILKNKNHTTAKSICTFLRVNWGCFLFKFSFYNFVINISQ